MMQLLAIGTVTAQLVALTLAAASPPTGAITVGPSGSGALYTSLAAALNDTSNNVYFIYSGSYTGQSVISRPNVVVYGQTNATANYASNTVTLTDNVPASSAGSNAASGTLQITSRATGVKLYNLNIVNTYGKPVDQSQAIALSVAAGMFACYACQIRGTQDTLLANVGTQFYGKSLIEGSVDFIFGMQASVWITGSVINTIGNGYITASGRSSDDANWYVIDQSTIQGTGTSFLGRPWRDHARVVFQNSNISSVVPPAGWSPWSSPPNTDHVLFGEFNNTGAGVWQNGRASFATLLNASVSIGTVLGTTSWIDAGWI